MYQESQWYAFQDILLNHKNRYNTMIRLNYYFVELQKIEIEYAEGLANLETYLSQVQEIGSLGKALDNIKECLANKIKKHFGFANILKQAFFNPETLKDYYAQHRGLSASFENEEAAFNSTALQVDRAKEKYHEILGKLEKSISSSTFENKSGAFDAAKLSSKYKSLIKSEEIERINYCKTINSANEHREVYVHTINEMLNRCEHIDNEFIGLIQNRLASYAKHEQLLYENLEKSAKDMLNEIVLISIPNDIKAFCDSTHRHGHPPNKFDFIVFKYDKALNTICKDNKNVTNTYKMEVKEYFRKNFKYFPPEGLKKPELVAKYNKLEEYTIKLWQGTEPMSKNALSEIIAILTERNFRLYFLKCANYFRLELFPLKEYQFSTLLNLMSFILKESMKTDKPDYEVIKFVIILSQTFYKVSNNPNEPQYLIQNDILHEEAWKSRALWEGLIDFTINADMSGSGKKMKEKEETEERIAREKTIVQICLVTFKFIMKCFKCSSREMEEIIKGFGAKYGLCEEIAALTEDEVQEMKEEIFEETNLSRVGIGESDQLVNKANQGRKDDMPDAGKEEEKKKKIEDHIE